MIRSDRSKPRRGFLFSLRWRVLRRLAGSAFLILPNTPTPTFDELLELARADWLDSQGETR